MEDASMILARKTKHNEAECGEDPAELRQQRDNKENSNS